MTTAAPPPPTIPSVPRRAVGLKRLLAIVFGWRGKPSHEVAANWLLVLGFVIEVIVLQQVVVQRFTGDFGSGKYQEKFLAVFILVLPILLALLAHQFMIFRNFALPAKIEARKRHLETTKIVFELKKQWDNNVVEAISVQMTKLCKLYEPAATIPGEKSQLRKKKVLEICIYCLFGVLTGEAGYMLTMLHEHSSFSWYNAIVRDIVSFFGTSGLTWGATLESMFLFCAAIICLCVLLWDFVVKASPSALDDYERLIKQFIFDDLWSLGFWISLFIVVNPRIRMWFGVQEIPTANGSIEVDLGRGMYFMWVALAVCSGFYVFKIAARFRRGIGHLAAEPSDEDAAHRKI